MKPKRLHAAPAACDPAPPIGDRNQHANECARQSDGDRSGSAVDDRRDSISRLLPLFAIIYAVEGLCAPRGLLGQPLIRFLKEGLGWSPTNVSFCFSVFALPWMIKPLFGLASDNLPLLGYRRKAYLTGANLLAACSLVLLATTLPLALMFAALMTVFTAMAVSSTACGGLLVEVGQRNRCTDLLANQQWLWLSLASIAATAGGGWFAQHYGPEAAISACATILCLAPIAIVVANLRLLDEVPVERELEDWRSKLQQLWAALYTRRFLSVLAFLFLYMFSPGFDVPLYYHLVNKLHFSQQFIGTLGSMAAAGSVCGALLHRYVLRGIGMRSMVYLAIILGSCSALSFLLLDSHWISLLIYFCSGIAGTISIIVAVTLAADFCPHGQEGFGFAILATAENVAITLSGLTGSFLYDHLFERRFAPLVLISAGSTVMLLLLVPLLSLEPRRRRETQTFP